MLAFNTAELCFWLRKVNKDFTNCVLVQHNLCFVILKWSYLLTLSDLASVKQEVRTRAFFSSLVLVLKLDTSAKRKVHLTSNVIPSYHNTNCGFNCHNFVRLPSE